ncbi:hypothetical protein JTB14_028463 [Gonioctena quinquepunctata]|nr:hypothetical protein JTB14_028463 [Gonioctena quinquepunctata]
MINDLVLGQEIIEIHNPLGIKTRSTATLHENQLKIYSKEDGGKSYDRLYNFNESGIQVVLSCCNGIKAKRFFKRL